MKKGNQKPIQSQGLTITGLTLQAKKTKPHIIQSNLVKQNKQTQPQTIQSSFEKQNKQTQLQTIQSNLVKQNKQTQPQNNQSKVVKQTKQQVQNQQSKQSEKKITKSSYFPQKQEINKPKYQNKVKQQYLIRLLFLKKMLSKINKKNKTAILFSKLPLLMSKYEIYSCFGINQIPNPWNLKVGQSINITQERKQSKLDLDYYQICILTVKQWKLAAQGKQIEESPKCEICKSQTYQIKRYSDGDCAGHYDYEFEWLCTNINCRLKVKMGGSG